MCCCANCSDSSKPFEPGGESTTGSTTTSAPSTEIPVLIEDVNLSRKSGW